MGSYPGQSPFSPQPNGTPFGAGYTSAGFGSAGAGYGHDGGGGGGGPSPFQSAAGGGGGGQHAAAAGVTPVAFARASGELPGGGDPWSSFLLPSTAPRAEACATPSSRFRSSAGPYGASVRPRDSGQTGGFDGRGAAYESPYGILRQASYGANPAPPQPRRPGSPPVDAPPPTISLADDSRALPPSESAREGLGGGGAREGVDTLLRDGERFGAEFGADGYDGYETGAVGGGAFGGAAAAEAGAGFGGGRFGCAPSRARAWGVRGRGVCARVCSRACALRPLRFASRLCALVRTAPRASLPLRVTRHTSRLATRVPRASSARRSDLCDTASGHWVTAFGFAPDSLPQLLGEMQPSGAALLAHSEGGANWIHLRCAARGPRKGRAHGLCTRAVRTGELAGRAAGDGQLSPGRALHLQPVLPPPQRCSALPRVPVCVCVWDRLGACVRISASAC
jgi:hypothetical protein